MQQITKPNPPTKIGTSPMTYKVDARGMMRPSGWSPWLNTEAFGEEGKTYRITATGTWNLNAKGGGSPIGPDGAPQNPGFDNWVDPTSNEGALICKIGINGKPFPVGSAVVTAAMCSGTDHIFYFACNDLVSNDIVSPGVYYSKQSAAYADNAGSMLVTIQENS